MNRDHKAYKEYQDCVDFKDTQVFLEETDLTEQKDFLDWR